MGFGDVIVVVDLAWYLDVVIDTPYAVHALVLLAVVQFVSTALLYGLFLRLVGVIFLDMDVASYRGNFIGGYPLCQ